MSLKARVYGIARAFRRLLALAVCSLLLLGLTNSSGVKAATGINEQINFQARLLTDTGAVVADGDYNIEFKIYQDGDGNLGGGDETLKWTETRTGGNVVRVRNGYFNVNLGSVTAFGTNIDFNQDTLWLSINIGGTGGTPSWDGEMDPFIRFTSVPYAFNAKNLQGLAASDFVQLAQGVQADSSTTNSSIFINKTGATANILQFQKSGTDVFTLSNTGDALFKSQTNSTTAFQIQTSDAFNVLTANTALSEAGSTSTFGAVARGVTVAGKYAYVTHSLSTGIGLEVVDITDPSAPASVGTAAVDDHARGIAVAGKYAYVGSHSTGDDLQIFDISNPSSPTEVGAVNLADSVGGWQGVAVQGKYAYVGTDSTGDDFHVIDVSDPTAPVEVDSLNMADSVNSVAVAGKYAYATTEATGDDFHVIDISNPTAVSEIDSIALPDAANAVYVSGRYAYVTTDITGDDFHVIDISDPTTIPAVVDSLELTAAGNGAFGVFVANDVAYVTYANVFQTIDVSDPTAVAAIDSLDMGGGNLSFGIEVHGRHAYIAAQSQKLHIINVPGVSISTATTGSLYSGNVTVVNDLKIGNNLSLQGGLNVGAGGLFVDAGEAAIESNSGDTALRILQRGAGDILELYDGANSVLQVADGGSVTFQTPTDSTTGFQVLDADGGTPVFNIDTTNERVGIQDASPATALQVNGAITLTEMSAPGTPASNDLVIYVKDNSGVSTLYAKDDSGQEYRLTGFPIVEATTLTDDTTIPSASWSDWATTTITISNPNQAVKILAQGNGSADISGSAEESLNNGMRMCISTDGGSTFGCGPGPFASIDNAGENVRKVNVTGQHVVTGTPTGSIVIKAELFATNNNVDFKDGFISVTIIGDY